MNDGSRAAPDSRAPLTHLLCLCCLCGRCGRYPGASIKLLEASDHALSDFDHQLPFVLAFLLGAPTGKASDSGMGQSLA